LFISNIDISTNNIKQLRKSSEREFRTSAYVQKPDTFERSTNVSFTGKSNRIKQYEKTAESLKTVGEIAQTSLNGQLATDGCAGKIADSISVLWNSKNRAVLVQSDIDTYNEQINELKQSIKENKFNEKFKEIFDVEYSNANIARYNKKAKQFNIAVTSKVMADITSSKLSENIKTYKENKGKLQDKKSIKVLPYAMTGAVPYYYETKTKESTLKDLENSLVSVLGSKEILNDTLKSSGLNTDKMSDDEKYSTYGIIAEFLVETTQETAKKCAKGKTIKELKEDYDNAYKKAYGTKNDIQARVDKYNRSQEIGAAAVRGVTRSAISAVVLLAAPEAGLAKIAAKAATVMGVKVLVDGSDKLSNNVDDDLTKDKFKNLVRSASISGAEKLASSLIGTFVPAFDTGYEILDEVLSQGKSTCIDTALGLTSEKLKKGNWATNQIIPRMVISTVFRNISPDDDTIKTLLDCTKGGVNQAMKYSTREYDVVKTFVEGTKQALKDIKSDDKKSLNDLKLLSKNNPEEYTNLMLNTLKKYIEENAKK